MALSSMKKSQKDFIISKVIDLAIQIQQIPAPTFHEQQRAAFVHQCFMGEGLHPEFDSAGNVLACISGLGIALPVVVVAHLDTVFPENEDLTISRQPDRLCGPGIGDNALGVAGLFGLMWRLRQEARQLPGDLWLVADVCEEGLGDLRGMRQVVQRFGDKVSAYIIIEGMALGQVYHRALGISRYRIDVRTPGGHSWTNFGQPSAIHELSALVVQLTNLPLSDNPRATLNVGKISGGTSVNTIANHAQIELDLRSEDQTTLNNLVDLVLSCVAAANKKSVAVTAELIGRRPSGELPADHPLVQNAMESLQNQRIQVHHKAGSTDANIPLSLGLPAVGVGISTGAGAHTPEEYILTAPVSQGLEALFKLVKKTFVKN